MHNHKSQALEWRKCYKMRILSYSDSSFSSRTTKRCTRRLFWFYECNFMGCHDIGCTEDHLLNASQQYIFLWAVFMIYFLTDDKINSISSRPLFRLPRSRHQSYLLQTPRTWVREESPVTPVSEDPNEMAAFRTEFIRQTGECHGCRSHNTSFGDLLSRDPRAFGIEIIPSAFVGTPEMHLVLKGAAMLELIFGDESSLYTRSIIDQIHFASFWKKNMKHHRSAMADGQFPRWGSTICRKT